MKKHNKSAFLTQSGVIAALYVVLTLVAKAMGLDSGQIQLRLSEALCVLPVFLPAAVPGLTVGCFLFNISFAGALPLDPVVGTIATLLAAWGMWLTRRVTVEGLPVWGLLMPAVANAFLVGWELSVYIGGAFWLNAVYVAIGEVAVLLTLGTALYYALKPHKARLFER